MIHTARILALLLAFCASVFSQNTPIKNGVFSGTMSGTPSSGTLNLTGLTLSLNASAISAGTISNSRLDADLQTLADSSAFFLSLADDTDANAARSTLGLIPSTAGAVIHVSKSTTATDTRTGLSDYDPAKPYATVKAAYDAADAGDTVVVYPGSYLEGTGGSAGITLRTDVFLHCYPGVTITYNGSGNPGLFNDVSAGAVTRITGQGKFVGTGTAGFYVNNWGSSLYVEADDITGTNGAVVLGDAVNGQSWQSKVRNMTGGITAAGANQTVIHWGNIIGVQATASGTTVQVYGNVGTTASGIGASFDAGTVRIYGNIYGNSDALQVKGTADVEVWGDCYSAQDAGVYFSTGGSTAKAVIHGNVISGGSNINLAGRGNGIAAAGGGSLTVFGNVSGPIGVVCGDSDVTIYGNVTSTASGSYSEQTPQLDTNFSDAAYRPSTASTQGDYIGVAALKLDSTGTLTIRGRVSSAYGHALKVDGGTLKLTGGDVVSSDGDGLTVTGDTAIAGGTRFDATGNVALGTFTVDTGTDTLTTSVAHGRNVGDRVCVTSTTTLPGGMSASVDYYVLTAPTTTTLTLSTTAGGSTLDITSTGSGTHSIFSAGLPVRKSGGTVRLAHCVMVSNTGRDTVGASSAQTVSMMGCWGNRAVSGNITNNITSGFSSDSDVQ